MFAGAIRAGAHLQNTLFDVNMGKSLAKSGRDRRPPNKINVRLSKAHTSSLWVRAVVFRPTHVAATQWITPQDAGA
jgi:hypothetical protein